MLTLTPGSSLGKSTFLLTATPPDDHGNGMLIVIALMFTVTVIMLGLLRAAMAPVADVVWAVVKGLAAFVLAFAVLILLVVAFALST
ncbi:hypothetical protein AB0J80_02955 [Actinoplanes sp. NPDC049548]|uniref:hypothetical protein n=1 Tax=Actinoplanes sp. NPDC049548 TaxID=3155152 RepID=UPI003430C366